MKKYFALLLMLLCLCASAMAEETGETYGVATMGDPAELAELIDVAESAPFVPENLEKAVFGSDDRTTINQTSKYPYCAIAYLKVKAHCGCEWTGSGFMVSKNCLATAAHCLVCKEHNKWASGVTMYFGYRSDKNYTYRYTDGTTYWYGANPYASGFYVADDDWAYMKLQKNVGETVGWFGIRHANDGQNGKTFTVTGYRNGVLKTSSGRVEILNNKLIKYNIDMQPGNSGCPVYDSENYAIAINVAENDLYNTARRFTSDVINGMYDNGMFD